MLAASLVLAATVLIPRQAEAATSTSFVNVDISGTLNPNDQPFGIECSGTDVYMTVFQQGLLARINKDTKAVSLIQHPEGPEVAGRGFYSLARDSSGNIYVNEVNAGRVLRFNPTSETWTAIPIVQNLDDPSD